MARSAVCHRFRTTVLPENLNLIRPGLLPLGQGQLYDRLFDQRQRSDYADLVHFGVQEVRVWYGEAQAFVAAVAVSEWRAAGRLA